MADEKKTEKPKKPSRMYAEGRTIGKGEDGKPKMVETKKSADAGSGTDNEGDAGRLAEDQSAMHGRHRKEMGDMHKRHEAELGAMAKRHKGA